MAGLPVKPTRQTQPHRRGARQPGLALDAMTKGRTSGGINPMDLSRAAQRMQKMLKPGGRPHRPARPERPGRPDR
jgi:hypothetical protein